jgi:hypothetical protein
MVTAMIAGSDTSATAPSGPGIDREAAIRLMAETLPLAGYRGVRADLPGWEQPETIHGAMKDHRPSLFCQAPRPVYFDVVAAQGALTLEELASRWQLFASAAELTSGEFHVVVPRWVAGRDGRQVAKQIAELVGVRIGFIWAI